MTETRNQGFTILEILLAVAILVIGLFGVLALFLAAIESGKATIQDTNAILIAQSVEQTLRQGLQHRKAQNKSGQREFFIFEHKGLYKHSALPDRLPRKIADARPGADYFILLPSIEARTKSPMPRDRAYEQGSIFIYPETDGKSWEMEIDGYTVDYEDDSGSMPNGNGDPKKADDDGDDWQEEGLPYPTHVIHATYNVSSTLLPQSEYDDEEGELGNVAQDPFHQYSFAFAIRRAYHDASLGVEMPTDRRFIPANELFEVQILVFRSFAPGTTHAEPIYTARVLVNR
ncbi:MAG: hypothetical protein V3T77_10555 [Planctomycetota bacterium]